MLFRTVAILGASLRIGYLHGYSALLELLMALVVLALGGWCGWCACHIPVMVAWLAGLYPINRSLQGHRFGRGSAYVLSRGVAGGG